jgi:hypothetical protein
MEATVSLSYYHDVFLIPATKARRGNALSESLGELEFGEKYRSPRFLAGWWVIPALMVYALAAIAIYFAT